MAFPIPLAIAVGACILLRLAFLPLAWPALSVPPDNSWWRWSESVLRHGTLGFEGAPSAYQEPLYPLFLAGVRFLTFDHVLGVALVQIVACALGTVLLYRLALRLSGDPAAAAIAALLFAGYPYLIRQSVSLIPLTVFTTALLGATLATTAIASRRGAFGCGLLWGIATGLRVTALPAAALCVAFLLLRRREHALLVALGALVVLVPMGLRNQSVDGVWLPTRGPYNLIKANSEYADVVIPRYSVDALEPVVIAMLHEIRPGLRVLDVADVDAEAARVFTRNALAFVRENPWRTLRMKLANVAYLFHWRIVPYERAIESRFGEGRFEVVQARPRARINRLGYTVPYLLVLAACLPGLWLRRRSLLGTDWPLLAVVAAFVATYAVYWPATKQRAPSGWTSHHTPRPHARGVPMDENVVRFPPRGAAASSGSG